MDHHEGGRFNLAELNPCRILAAKARKSRSASGSLGSTSNASVMAFGTSSLRTIFPNAQQSFLFWFSARNGFNLVAMKKGGLTVAVDHRQFSPPNCRVVLGQLLNNGIGGMARF